MFQEVVILKEKQAERLIDRKREKDEKPKSLSCKKKLQVPPFQERT